MSSFNLPQQIEAESTLVRDLPFSQLRLQNMKIVPWLILVPRRSDVTEIYQLAPEERGILMDEITLASQAIAELYKPFKINVASLGNVVSHLHVHVIGRYENDPAWPKPVWGQLPPAPFASNDLERERQKVNSWFEKN